MVRPIRKPSIMYPSRLTPPRIPQGKKVVLFDDFLGTEPSSHWTGAYNGTPGGTKGRFLASHVKVNNSIMNLQMYQDTNANDPLDNNWAGAGIQTVTRWPVGSIVQVALRIDSHPNIVGIALMMGDHWPPEIDFLEGGAAHIHWGASNNQKQFAIPFSIDQSKWHIWEVHWTTSKIILLCDGVQYGSMTNPTTDPNDINGLLQNQFLSLQIQDGDPGYPTPDATITVSHPVQMQIDWVRILE